MVKRVNANVDELSFVIFVHIDVTLLVSYILLQKLDGKNI